MVNLKQIIYHNTIDSNIGRKWDTVKGSLSFEMTKDTERAMLDYAEHHYNERYFLLYVAKREWSDSEERPQKSYATIHVFTIEDTKRVAEE